MDAEHKKEYRQRILPAVVLLLVLVLLMQGVRALVTRMLSKVGT